MFSSLSPKSVYISTNIRQRVTCLFSATQLRMTLTVPTERYKTRALQIVNNTVREGA